MVIEGAQAKIRLMNIRIGGRASALDTVAQSSGPKLRPSHRPTDIKPALPPPYTHWPQRRLRLIVPLHCERHRDTL